MLQNVERLKYLRKALKGKKVNFILQQPLRLRGEVGV
jgi:hypothetical protein